MANINIKAGLFDCTDPTNPYAIQINIGTTYRTGYEYIFNYSWNTALYNNVGLSTEVIMYYSADGQGAVLYPGTMPDNANDFLVNDIPPHDTVSFELHFIVGDPQICLKNEFINPNDIILVP